MLMFRVLLLVATGLLTACGGKRGDPSTASTAAPLASTTASSPTPAVGLTCHPRGPFGPGPVYYSQFYEDYILSHVFEGIRDGVYVDVGANDPDDASVTKYFYLAGWRGINIEPDPNMFALLAKNRPDDVNLEVGISDKPGTLAFYRFENEKGLSTFDRNLALRHQAMGARFQEIHIPMSTLDQALAPYEKVAHEFAFLNVDVEGFERQVFASFDLKQHRPSVILAEATEPLTETASYQPWEPMFFAAGYLFAMDDGLNRYYVQPDRKDLLTRFVEANYCVQADKVAKGIRLNGYLPYGR